MDRSEVAKSLDVIEIDYNAADIPPGVRDLQPLVYCEGDNICVMEGTNPMDGLFGCGSTMAEALADFQQHYDDAKQDSV